MLADKIQVGPKFIFLCTRKVVSDLLQRLLGFKVGQQITIMPDGVLVSTDQLIKLYMNRNNQQ